MSPSTPTPLTAPAPPTRSPLTRRQWRQQRAGQLVGRYTVLASGSTWVPVPGLDLGVELWLQIRMARELCALYGAPFSAAAAGEVASGLVGGTSLKARTVTALRYVSFATYWTGGLPSLATTAGFTWLLGQLLIERLEAHGRIELPLPTEPLAEPTNKSAAPPAPMPAASSS